MAAIAPGRPHHDSLMTSPANLMGPLLAEPLNLATLVIMASFAIHVTIHMFFMVKGDIAHCCRESQYIRRVSSTSYNYR